MARRDSIMHKPRDARGAFRRMVAFLGPHRYTIALVAGLCVLSNLLALWGPNLAGSAINEAAAGAVSDALADIAFSFDGEVMEVSITPSSAGVVA